MSPPTFLTVLQVYTGHHHTLLSGASAQQLPAFFLPGPLLRLSPPIQSLIADGHCFRDICNIGNITAWMVIGGVPVKSTSCRFGHGAATAWAEKWCRPILTCDHVRPSFIEDKATSLPLTTTARSIHHRSHKTLRQPRQRSYYAYSSIHRQ